MSIAKAFVPTGIASGCPPTKIVCLSEEKQTILAGEEGFEPSAYGFGGVKEKLRKTLYYQRKKSDKFQLYVKFPSNKKRPVVIDRVQPWRNTLFRY